MNTDDNRSMYARRREVLDVRPGTTVAITTFNGDGAIEFYLPINRCGYLLTSHGCPDQSTTKPSGLKEMEARLYCASLWVSRNISASVGGIAHVDQLPNVLRKDALKDFQTRRRNFDVFCFCRA